MKFVFIKADKIIVMKSFQVINKKQFTVALFCMVFFGVTVNAQRGGHSGGGSRGGSSGGSSFSGSSSSAPSRSFSAAPYSAPSHSSPSPTYNNAPSRGSSPVNIGVVQGNRSRFEGVAQNHVLSNGRAGVLGGVGYGGRGVAGGVGYGGRGGFGYGHGRGYFSPYYIYPYYPTIGLRLGFLPFGYYSFYWNDYPYYYYNSVFYRRTDDNNYEVVQPPLGAHVPTIPNNSKQVIVDGNRYFESSGTYYQEEVGTNNTVQYVVVGVDGILNQPQSQMKMEPQVGDVVPQLPSGCTTVYLNGQKYFEAPNNVYYQEIQDGNGIAYKIVGK